MSLVNYAARYGELDGLFKKYCDKKKKESKSLHKLLEEEIATNVELRKYIALLESKLLSAQDNASHLERLYRDALSHANDSDTERGAQLREMASDVSSRLLLVEQREREYAERAAALELREEQFWLSFNEFQRSRADLEVGLAASRKTMEAQLQHTRETVDVAEDCLCEIKDKGKDLTEREKELDYETQILQQRMFLELEERSLRETIAGYELEARCNLVGTFFHKCNLHLKKIFSRNMQKEHQLKTTTDLLHLHEVEFSTRVRKERDLFQDERSKAELMRDAFILDCKNALREVSELLDSISEKDAETLRLDLEAKLRDMLQPHIRSVT